ncbi:uncharacterized protein MAM_03092 [Metarhizium album ARSEF 1941]|uniref:Pal1-like protein n=1 Tax=Metarhizium album (strain ARSEF 1941) TaxID=1081103 RepID=A0A0B2X0M0_METAS|nr:uncharacterized protein MAM_03092 [Metarhizium album ARSEF 1941]KHN99394.1 hypothetical protein MAM_03092 [Metarhizium album ARSEF 1941]
MSSAINIARRRSLPERSIRVLVSPTPVTFAERRSVLQVLEQYGPVEVFKMTPGYHANFVSVTKEIATASRLVEYSPLTYDVPENHINTDVCVADLDDSESGNGLKSNQPCMTTAPGHPPGKRQFTLEIFPAPTYRHHFAMAGSPLYQSWPAAYREDKSFLAATLKQSLPQTMCSSGLAHWLFDVGSNNASKSGRKAERLQLKRWVPGKMQD